jgi:hypothetical protein
MVFTCSWKSGENNRTESSARALVFPGGSLDVSVRVTRLLQIVYAALVRFSAIKPQVNPRIGAELIGMP